MFSFFRPAGLPSRRLARARATLLGGLLLALVGGLPTTPAAFAQQTDDEPAQAEQAPPCDEALEVARRGYFAGRFDESAEQLQRCIGQNAFTDDERQRAHVLLGKIYLASNAESRARAALEELVTLVPEYEPDAADVSPAFVTLVEDIKRERSAEEQVSVEEEGRDWTRWLVIGGGTVAAGLAATLVGVLAGGGGDDGGSSGGGGLPAPPSPPSGN